MLLTWQVFSKELQRKENTEPVSPPAQASSCNTRSAGQPCVHTSSLISNACATVIRFSEPTGVSPPPSRSVWGFFGWVACGPQNWSAAVFKPSVRRAERLSWFKKAGRRRDRSQKGAKTICKGKRAREGKQVSLYLVSLDQPAKKARGGIDGQSLSSYVWKLKYQGYVALGRLDYKLC